MCRMAKRQLILTCKDCGSQFELSVDEQRFFQSHDLELPKRCKDCRRNRRIIRLEEEKKKAAEDRCRKAEEEEQQLQVKLSGLPFEQILLSNITFADPQNTLVIIGNGFDMMHGVKSSYWEFQKTIGKNSPLRFNMETYLDTGDLWSNLEESLGKLNYSMFLNPYVIDMWLEDFGAYDPDAQAADFCAAVETAISPTFDIPRELGQRFRKWLKTLQVEGSNRPFSKLNGNYRVLSFNYTEFIETLYGAKRENVCYIHGCRRTPKGCKPDEIILGHKPGMEEEQWEKVQLKPFKFKNPYKKYIMEFALEMAAREASWYDDETTKKCDDIINKHKAFFESLTNIKEIYVIGHSLSEVDYPYFLEVCSKCDAHWFIGYHSLADLNRLTEFVAKMGLQKVSVFRT